MDKNAIKKYAVWARREFISRVSQKAYQYGIREKDIVDANADSIDGKILTDSEKKERKALIVQVREKGFEQVMEEVAYTWFNRFSALRFMEVNGYLPTHVRIFTDDENNFRPQIITEAIHLELDGLDMDKIYAYVETDNKDELYKYLLITQCNSLNKILPGMFQKIADYTELLFPDNLLREGSVIEQMITLIPEEDWKDAVQIIGWLYQYYNSEPKDTVFANLKKNVKISKENIPAATQLFTPDWIVRYMVENSIGRLWLEGHPDDDLKAKWNYYLDEAEQESDVQVQLAKMHDENKNIKPEEIRLIDPCMGSGHILIYAFDVLMQIYEAYGFNQRDAVKSIIENNIYGLDIDERAAQLAYFAVMMKARQYDRRFFNRDLQPHVYAISESNRLDKYGVEYFVNGDTKLKADMQTLINELYDAKEYGSILNVSNVDFDAMYTHFEEIKDDISIYKELVFKELLPFVQVAQAMAQKYDVVVTNPPYMGSRGGMNSKLYDFINKYYPDAKTDLYSVFIERCKNMAKPFRFYAMITQHGWMFLTSFKKIRYSVLCDDIINLLHLGARTFDEISGEVVQSVSFVNRKTNIVSYKGAYSRLLSGNSESEKEKAFLQKEKLYYLPKKDFELIEDKVIAYWISKAMFNTFKNKPLGDFAKPRQGMATSDNNRFLRLWYEVNWNKVCLDAGNENEAIQSNAKWFPYNKGGGYRKWYGNNDYLINWENNGKEIKELAEQLYKCATRTIKNIQFYFQEGVTWSTLASGSFNARYCKKGFLFDTKGSTCYFDDTNQIMYFTALLNSNVANELFKVLAPTLDYNAGSIAKLPVVVDEAQKGVIDERVSHCISISQFDWNSAETSWDFIRNPLIGQSTTIKEAYTLWESECNDRFNQLKTNEEELNHIFLGIYGLQDELAPEVEDKDVTVRKADILRDIKGLISYAVGCMFGRYSLYTEGLLYAGGSGGDFGSLVERVQDSLKEKGLSMFPENEFYPDADNIIPICDDEYFSDDIMGRFVKFIEIVYGTYTLEENLKFIADALGGNGMPRDVIRNYFLNDFYADHSKMYQKRPIYWLFDSGKKNSFKALIYMHRYQPDTIARMRTDYVHEQQERYHTAIVHLEQRINDAPTSERVKLNKQLGKLKEQDAEIRVYEEKIHHLADQMIRIDLDDGINHNYEMFKDVLAKIK